MAVSWIVVMINNVAVEKMLLNSDINRSHSHTTDRNSGMDLS